MQIKRLTPMLNVSDIERSLDFYQKLARFELVSPRQAVDQWRWACIRSGAAELMLSGAGGPATRGDRIDPAQHDGWPAIYYFYPDNVADLHAEPTLSRCSERKNRLSSTAYLTASRSFRGGGRMEQVRVERLDH